MTSPPPGVARRIEVPPHRLARWLAGFTERHGPVQVRPSPEVVVLAAADGAVAECAVPFPPLRDSLVEHVRRERTVGVLLVRLGGYAAGVFVGDVLQESKVGSRPVHGRSAAGGQSQQRFARRREGQARVALAAAADNAVRVLLPQADRLDAVVTGGDRSALASVLADPRLDPLLPLVQQRVLAVPTPRRAVLEATPQAFCAVQITLRESG